MEFLKKSKLFYFLVTLVLILVSIWLLRNVSFILNPFYILFKVVVLPVGIAGYLYYIFVPLLNFLKKKLKKENLSILLIFTLIGIIFLAMVVFLSSLLGQIQIFIARMPSHLTTLGESLKYILGELNIEEVYIIDSLELLNLSVFQVLSIIANNILDLVLVATRSVLSIVMALITIPIVLFYMFKDGSKIRNSIIKICPKKFHSYSEIILKDIHLKLSSFIGGQVLVCMYVGVSSYILFKFTGIPYAIFLASIAGVMDIVPYIGPWLGVFPAFILAWIISPQTAIIILLIFIIIQTIESYVVYPAIMGKNLKMHSLTIIFLIMFAGSIGGILGMIVAIPLYSVFKSIFINISMFKNKDQTQV